MSQISFCEIYALINGTKDYPNLRGKITFSEVYGGTMVCVSVEGLPENEGGNFYGFHIHEETESGVGSHYNPEGRKHPFHAGDFPVLLGNRGFAWCKFYTNRFYPEDVIGKCVVIHLLPDDYRSQPAGNAGDKIACGVIKSKEE